MRNRYGEVYNFEKVSDNTYIFVGDTRWCRCGGKDGQETIDYNDLGFFDPSGGPFITEGYPIDGKKVVNISIVENQIQFLVE